MDSGTDTSLPGHSPRRSKRSRFSCRRIDRLFCKLAGLFPLFFVYGTTSWAVYVEAYSISYHAVGGWTGFLTGSIGMILYALAIWSYTFAVFTSPGTPMDPNTHTYSYLPTTSIPAPDAVTVKSDGQERFCKKCQFRKPDRTHHCSSCRTCVLKMDHHCPWLANCLGLRNYKAFLLFLLYTSVFCIVCFAVSCRLVYTELFTTGGAPGEEGYSGNIDDLAPVNWVLLAVVSGIIGLVLSGFTIWHLVLTGSNMTTIESLEKVRYTAPSLRRGNAPPGAQLLTDDGSFEGARAHEHNRYGNYLLEESSKKLPHAFDLGRKSNFAQVFGGRKKMLLWAFPVFSGFGDGWAWETSREWQEAALAVKAERDKWMGEQRERERAAGWGYDPDEEAAWTKDNPVAVVVQSGKGSKADRLLGRKPGAFSDAEGVPLRTLVKRRPSLDMVDDDDDDEDENDEYDEDEIMGKEAETSKLIGKKTRPPERTSEDVEWGAWGD